MALSRFTTLLSATFWACQMVAVLGFVAPKTSVTSSGSEGFWGEAWQGAGQRRGRSCASTSRREMDAATMRLGVSTSASVMSLLSAWKRANLTFKVWLEHTT